MAPYGPASSRPMAGAITSTVEKCSGAATEGEVYLCKYIRLVAGWSLVSKSQQLRAKPLGRVCESRVVRHFVCFLASRPFSGEADSANMATAAEFILDMLGSELFLKGAGGAAFALHNADTWQWWHYVAWFAIVLLGMEILSQLVLLFGKYVPALISGLVHKNKLPFGPLCYEHDLIHTKLLAGSDRASTFPTGGSIWTNSSRSTSLSSLSTGGWNSA